MADKRWHLCEILQNEGGHVCVEAANCPDFTAEMEGIKPNGGLHFCEIGYYTLAKCVAEEIKKI